MCFKLVKSGEIEWDFLVREAPRCYFFVQAEHLKILRCGQRVRGHKINAHVCTSSGVVTKRPGYFWFKRW